jgi:argininosuccinate lyase
MYLRSAILQAVEANLDFVDGLLRIDDDELAAILPGYTHSQGAQPITVAFWKSAFASMLLRDVQRLRDCYVRADECPLGSCALAGTSFPLDRDYTAQLLGFSHVLLHALDATSTRDYLLEVAGAIANGALTLSRMAEEIVVWSSHEYRLCEVADEYATGSSIMPQKKNPVVAELARARVGRTLGTFVQVATAVKGIGLGYSCDLQEDKPYIWDSIDTYISTLVILRAQSETLRFDTKRGEQLCWANFSTATELANYLVTERGMSFREAHRVTGELVGHLISEGQTLRDVQSAARALDALGISIAEDVLQLLFNPAVAVEGYVSPGGTSSQSVRLVVAHLGALSTEQRSWLRATSAHLTTAKAATFEAARRLAVVPV